MTMRVRHIHDDATLATRGQRSLFLGFKYERVDCACLIALPVSEV